MADTQTPNIQLTNQTEGGNNNTWGQIADANFEEIDDKFGDTTSVSTTGGNTTLTASQEIVAAIKVTGTLATNAVIVFSGRGGVWVVDNQTTGPYTLTAKVSGQTGVEVAQDRARSVYCDGTDISYSNSDPGVITPIGTVMDYAGTTEPDGWLFLYGQNVSRTTEAALFAVIGTTYGVGDGVTTFGLPDGRGRVVAGKDDMGGASANRLTDQTGGLDGDVLGDSGGAETHTLLQSQLPLFSLDLTGLSISTILSNAVNLISSTSLVALNGGSTGLGGVSGGTRVETPTAASTLSGSVGSGGSDAAHNIVQPTLILNKIIYTGG